MGSPILKETSNQRSTISLANESYTKTKLVQDITFIHEDEVYFEGNGYSWTEKASINGCKITVSSLRDDYTDINADPSFYSLDLRTLSRAQTNESTHTISVPVGGLVMAQMSSEFAQTHKDEEFHAGTVIEINDSSSTWWTEAVYGYDASSGEEYIYGSHRLESGTYRVIMGFSIVETYHGEVRGPFDKPILLQRIR
jgi:hypothetical protein